MIDAQRSAKYAYSSFKAFGLVALMLSMLGAPLAKAEAAATDDRPSETQQDPWQSFNQKTHALNEGIDQWLLRPLAVGYVKVVPGFARVGVSNFFANLGDAGNSVNNFLQGKLLAGTSDLGRILVNSTLGIGGLFDPASGLGLKKHNESFSQTIAVWGVPKGPYVVLPFLGPSTLTDAFAQRLDGLMDPVRYLYPLDHRNSLLGTRLIDQRSSFLEAEKAMKGDRYTFFRDAYLQRREYQVNDISMDQTRGSDQNQ